MVVEYTIQVKRRAGMEKLMNLSDSSVRHFEGLASLSMDLSGHGLAIVEHRYHLLAFGSFELVVGHTHRRLRLVWDGKDGLLDVSVSSFRNQSSRPSWKAYCTERADWASVFTAVGRVCHEAFKSPAV